MMVRSFSRPRRHMSVKALGLIPRSDDGLFRPTPQNISGRNEDRFRPKIPGKNEASTMTGSSDFLRIASIINAISFRRQTRTFTSPL